MSTPKYVLVYEDGKLDKISNTDLMTEIKINANKTWEARNNAWVQQFHNTHHRTCVTDPTVIANINSVTNTQLDQCKNNAGSRPFDWVNNTCTISNNVGYGCWWKKK